MADRRSGSPQSIRDLISRLKERPDIRLGIRRAVSVDAVEVANGGTVESENRFALKVAQQLGRYKTGGSDAHSVNGLGRCVTVFQDQICSEKAFIEALKLGRYYPALGLKGQKLAEYK